MLDDNLRDVFAVVWGQCSTYLQSIIKQDNDYEQKKIDADCAWLLSQIQSIIFKFAGRKQKFLAIVEARTTHDRCKQRDEESNASFLDQFKTVVESYEHTGGSIGNDDGLIEELTDTNNPEHPGNIPTGSDADEV